MKQFEYEIINKITNRVEHARATAKTEEIARGQIVVFYGKQFTVSELFSDVNPPHYILGEIDCSDFPLSDLQWLNREVFAIERAKND